MNQRLIELLQQIDTLAMKDIHQRMTTEAIETDGNAEFGAFTKIDLHGISVANDSATIAVCHFLEAATNKVNDLLLCQAAELRLRQPCAQLRAMTDDCDLILARSKCPHQRQIAEQTRVAISNKKAIA